MNRPPGNRRWGKVVRIADVNRVFWDTTRFVFVLFTKYNMEVQENFDVKSLITSQNINV